jgi:hypothetical protein
MLQIEYDFELPAGYVDSAGTLHRDGVMRLATAADEILPMKDPRVLASPAYLVVILLSRVVTRIGTVTEINPSVIEGLFAQDLDFLLELYNDVNGLAPRTLVISCPNCEQRFTTAVPPPGESSATPWTGSTKRSPSLDSVSTGPMTSS